MMTGSAFGASFHTVRQEGPSNYPLYPENVRASPRRGEHNPRENLVAEDWVQSKERQEIDPSGEVANLRQDVAVARQQATGHYRDAKREARYIHN
ncbi:hypothetical protein [Spirillospora sp. CA-128828]|uniref:hypothetical protein n=1 Tax=Spirillospora sp. CA-128828 TaxID=3240033 RepID=UPI003D923399